MQNNHFKDLNKADSSEQNTFYTGLYYAEQPAIALFSSLLHKQGAGFFPLENVPRV